MDVLYIVAAEQGAGKTAIGAGLAINLMNAGKKVGYFKPQAAENDSDVAFMKQISGLEIISKATNLTKGRDVVLVEAVLENQTSDAARDMKAKVIAVETYAGRIFKYGSAYKKFGDSFLGVIINKVPQGQLKRVKAEVAEKYGAVGIKVLGVIPDNRTLLAITIGELAECIGGKILNHQEKTGELVENYMLGAMTVDSGLDYFGRKKNKAVVIRQERLDMQLAALETSTSCLVLSGGDTAPTYGVRQRAESRGIPIITTDAAVNDIVTKIDKLLGKNRLSQKQKLIKLADTVKQNLDLKVFG
ncbi:MAG: DRTGG domain-containing protein [Dehalococcoidales bacterium]